MIPKARGITRSTGAIYGLAGVTAAAPLFFMMPGAEERLSAQARWWIPQWQRNLSYVTPAVAKTTAVAEPAVKRSIEIVEPTLKSAAQLSDRNAQRIFGHPTVQKVVDPDNVGKILKK